MFIKKNIVRREEKEPKSFRKRFLNPMWCSETETITGILSFQFT